MQQVKQRGVGLGMVATQLGQALVWCDGNINGHGEWLDSFNTPAIWAGHHYRRRHRAQASTELVSLAPAGIGEWAVDVIAIEVTA
jgi:hypothetical protein